ncbi:DMT family transporter [uncultured Rhodospira sp.]|uniref:DMT family transporter n=1 Tax=uncultured Rhodospira sp. TaxID=1936189 RepID=UPI00262B54A5|nr:DMT family transporter [uncultured Rhodospira sp.]
MGFLALVFVSMLWGSSFLIIKIVAGTFDPLTIAAGRLAVAAVCMMAVAAAVGAQLPRDLGTWLWLLVLAAVGQMAPFFLLGMSGHLTSSVNMATMMAASPLCTLFLGMLFPSLREPRGLRTWLGILVGLGGVLLVLGVPASDGAGWTDWAGKGLAGLAAAGYALGALISRRLAGRVGLTATVAMTLTISAGVLGVVWGITEAPGMLGSGPPEAGPLAALVLLGATNTALAYVVYYWLVRHEGATFAALHNYLVPAFGVVLGALVLGEVMAPTSLIGLAVILAGVAIVRGVGLGPARWLSVPRPSGR